MEKEISSLDQFVLSVHKDFERNKENLLAHIQKLVPSIVVTDIELIGGYKAGTPSTDSDIDLLVKYKGDISEYDLHSILSGKLYGYGGVYDIVPQRLAENKSSPFIQSLIEARLFRYEGDFSGKKVSQVGTIAYCLFLMCEVLRHYDSTFVKKYASDTYFYGDFSGVRTYATDLHNILAMLSNSGLRSKLKNDANVTVPQFAINRYLRDLAGGVRGTEKALDRQFFYELQSKLKISDSNLSTIRRNLVDVQYVSNQEYRDSAERLNRILDSIAIYTDLQWEYKTVVRQKLLNS